MHQAIVERLAVARGALVGADRGELKRVRRRQLVARRLEHLDRLRLHRWAGAEARGVRARSGAMAATGAATSASSPAQRAITMLFGIGLLLPPLTLKHGPSRGEDYCCCCCCCCCRCCRAWMSACLHPGDSSAKCSLMHALMRPPPGCNPPQNCARSALQAASGPDPGPAGANCPGAAGAPWSGAGGAFWPMAAMGAATSARRPAQRASILLLDISLTPSLRVKAGPKARAARFCVRESDFKALGAFFCNSKRPRGRMGAGSGQRNYNRKLYNIKARPSDDIRGSRMCGSAHLIKFPRPPQKAHVS